MKNFQLNPHLDVLTRDPHLDTFSGYSCSVCGSLYLHLVLISVPVISIVMKRHPPGLKSEVPETCQQGATPLAMVPTSDPNLPQ